MEQLSYSELKCSLSSIPAKALNISSRQMLSRLDHHQPLLSPKSYARDYRGLAELMGFQCLDVKRFEEYKDRSTKILDTWETRLGSTLDKLIGYLEDMDRYDIIQDLIPTLEKDVAEYKESLVQDTEEKCVAEYQKSQVVQSKLSTPVQAHEEQGVAEYKKPQDAQSKMSIPVQVDEVTSGLRKRTLTVQDLQNGECTAYDAYLAYDDDDIEEAFEIAQKLESVTVGLKLYIRFRDLLAGNFEFETHMELIMNRCRRMLMILTPNFIRNPTLEFQVNFAAKLGVERNERILIPVVVKSCGIPPVLRDMKMINLTKKYCMKELWDNLVLSILPEKDVDYCLPSLERGPLNNMNMISNSACSASEDMD